MAQVLRTQIAALEMDLKDNPNMPERNPQKWLSSLQFARSTISTLASRPQLPNQLGSGAWIRLIQALQKLAYQDPDAGGEIDIALWCERQWATEVQRQPNSISALQGLGHAWLLKSQKTLARIYREEGSPSSSSSSTSMPRNRIRNHMRNHEQDTRDSTRINSPAYVEARDTLRPSLESFDRALGIANAQGGASGDLLTLVRRFVSVYIKVVNVLMTSQSAEAFISFGNVSHPQRNEPYYQKALRLLRAASELEGYRIELHLQNFLDENVRYIE
ncbi:hypothetical protein MMC11_005692 [Xylographa trunciseda]|nr:hypothetical protein [Xylographa trunciseda]